MAALRSIASSAAFAAVRRTPTAVSLGRRGYAEAADKIKLSLVLPHQVRLAFARLPYVWVFQKALSSHGHVADT